MATATRVRDANGRFSTTEKGGVPVPVKKRGGWPLTHALYTGRLPPGCGYMAKAARTFQAHLADAVMEQFGELGVAELCSIQTATEWLIVALKIRRYLRTADATLTIEKKIEFSTQAATALSKRDAAVRALGLTPGQRPGADALLAIPWPEDADTGEDEPGGDGSSVVVSDHQAAPENETCDYRSDGPTTASSVKSADCTSDGSTGDFVRPPASCDGSAAT